MQLKCTCCGKMFEFCCSCGCTEFDTWDSYVYMACTLHKHRCNKRQKCPNCRTLGAPPPPDPGSPSRAPGHHGPMPAQLAFPPSPICKSCGQVHLVYLRRTDLPKCPECHQPIHIHTEPAQVRGDQLPGLPRCKTLSDVSHNALAHILTFLPPSEHWKYTHRDFPDDEWKQSVLSGVHGRCVCSSFLTLVHVYKIQGSEPRLSATGNRLAIYSTSGATFLNFNEMPPRLVRQLNGDYYVTENGFFVLKDIKRFHIYLSDGNFVKSVRLESIHGRCTYGNSGFAGNFFYTYNYTQHSIGTLTLYDLTDTGERIHTFEVRLPIKQEDRKSIRLHPLVGNQVLFQFVDTRIVPSQQLMGLASNRRVQTYHTQTLKLDSNKAERINSRNYVLGRFLGGSNKALLFLVRNKRRSYSSFESSWSMDSIGFMEVASGSRSKLGLRIKDKFLPFHVSRSPLVAFCPTNDDLLACTACDESDVLLRNWRWDRTVSLYGRNVERLGHQFKILDIAWLPNGGLAVLTSIIRRRKPIYCVHTFLRDFHSAKNALLHDQQGTLCVEVQSLEQQRKTNK